MLRILICDDSPINTEILSSTLTYVFIEKELHIVSRHSGNAGLKIAREQVFDIIITDLEMPDGDGLVLIDGIKLRGENTTTPVFIWSASDIQNKDEFIVSMGANGWLQKPIDIEELEEKLKRFIR